MFFKIYFGINVFLVLLTPFVLLKYFTFFNVIDSFILIISCIGLYGYVYRVLIFKQSLWKVYFVINLFWDFSSVVIYGFKNSMAVTSFQWGVIIMLTFLLVVPGYIALYRYAFKEDWINR